MERLKNCLENIFCGDRLKNFCEDLFFFGEHLRLCPWSLALASSIPVLGLESVCPRKDCPWPRIFFVSLVLGLEHSCPWPRECLSSERLSLASDFFCVLGPWPWPQVFLSLASRVSVLGKTVLGLGFFLCPWPWPRALCPRLHLWKISIVFLVKAFFI